MSTAPKLRRTSAGKPAIAAVFACALTLLLSVALAGRARADAENNEVVNKITKLNKKAIDEYENLNFDEARKILKDALDLCTQAGLDKHPVAARTYVHLGVVMLSGFKQRDTAVKYFRKAQEIDPGIKLTKSLANPEVQEVFDEASAGAAKPEPGDGSSRPPAPEGLTHEPVTGARQGSTVPVSATVDAALGADKVVLAYRPDGAAEFLTRDMDEASPGNYEASIPASATTGAAVAYYIEARKDGEAVASRGSRSSPLVVALASAPVVTRRSRAPEGETSGTSGEGSKIFISLAVGSGLGWTTGSGEVNSAHNVSPGGFAPAQLGHIAPEIGYFVRPGLLLSLQGRIQMLSGVTSQTCASGCSPPPSYAFAGFVKATWLLGEEALQPYVSVAVGGGTIRHVTDFKTSSDPSCGSLPNMTCVESVASGAVLLGPGAGLIYKMTPSFGLLLALNTQLGFPKFTFNADLNAGVAVLF